MADDAALLREFFKEVTDTQREAEVTRIVGCFRLNPFDFLNLPYNADENAIKKQFRKLSLMVHPDKNKHPKARDAFDQLKAAVEWLNDAERRKDLDWKLGEAKESAVKAFRKKYKKDEALREKWKAMGSSTRDEATAAYEGSDEFLEAWKLEAKELITAMAWQKRKMEKRLKDEEDKVKIEEQKTREEFKRKRQENKQWEQGTESRVNSWRDFAGGSKKKKSKKDKKAAGWGGLGAGGFRPPTAQAEARSADGLKSTSAVNVAFK